MITLHDYWRSSASYRVRIALGLAGLDWECRPVNLLEEAHKSDGYLKLNPQGLVPTIDLNGTFLTQSLAIIEYLDETHNLGLLPQDPLSRAKVRALSYAIAIDIHPVCNRSVASYAVDQSGGNLPMERWMQRFMSNGLAAVESMVDGTRHCFGDKVTLADICLVPQLYNAGRWGIDLTGMPKIQTIDANLAAIPAFSAAHPDMAQQD